MRGFCQQTSSVFFSLLRKQLFIPVVEANINTFKVYFFIKACKRVIICPWMYIKFIFVLTRKKGLLYTIYKESHYFTAIDQKS
jgi:hypothetical protein